MALKGEQRQKKNWGCKGGLTKFFKFCSDGICDNANNLPSSTRMPKTSISDVQKVQIFPGKHASGPSILLYKKSNSTPLKCKKQNVHTQQQQQTNSNVSLRKNNLSYHNKKWYVSGR